ncbi:unnamed protein product [Kuraishia capsulata CBS 1993]|uniref:Arrestin-like N-terminal domain-containing protein n=1 Tax=Kuraishia capsulata CBS 1993 TaxID=1382522 RepID=W6MMP0_9ASCO|nr:uncharacterized protein KUCA_T00003810001 [Kuraishia capsulata CBS 1993]CDK27831.1 unnamed protein product [Kuraishia capsulata CBS 1993]
MVSSCDLSVRIDKTATGGTFTNHDILKGRVSLKVRSDIALSSIHVKLEGISKTVIEIPREVGNGKKPKNKPLIEVHRLLYDTLMVWPSAELRRVSSSKEFTLVPGDYEFPFQFTIPLKNRCSNNKSLTGISNRFQFINGFSSPGTNTSIEFVSEASRHVETTLPPSLSGLNDFATVKYFVKATAKRPSLLKMNFRSYDPFIFLPVDFPNVMLDQRQCFTRRDFVFKQKYPEIVAFHEKADAPLRVAAARRPSVPTTPRRRSSSSFLKSIFNLDEPAQPTQVSQPAPQKSPAKQKDYYEAYEMPKVDPIDLPVGFEARFRYPAFVIPTRPPNYKLYLMTKLAPKRFELVNGQSSGLGYVFVKSLKFELISTTTVLIQGHRRQIVTKENVLTLGGINCKLDLMKARKSKALDPKTGGALYELEIPKDIYSGAVLPDHIAPTFKTCNISRKYRLLVTGGFSATKTGPVIEVGLDTEITVLSGLQLVQDNSMPLVSPQAIHEDEGSWSSISTPPQSQTQQQSFYNVDANNSESLPTYEQVLRQEDQDNHRRRFEQSDQYYTNLE